MTKIISFLITLILLFESVPMIGQKTLTVDAGNILGETTTRATGFLYGLAEKEVPSSAITGALKISLLTVTENMHIFFPVWVLQEKLL